MNTRELRIGNWVYAPIKSDYIPARIVNLGEKTWMGRTIDGKHIDGLHDVEFDTLKSIKPIELTEQMLLGNGFILNKNGLFKGKEGINLLRSGDGWEGVIFNKTSHCDFYRDKIYIHELQNLYYEINKKELDFKL
jgi:hypothetical protein